MALDEAVYAERLAELRWGDDWACARCGGRERYHLVSRPRVFQCVCCKAQCSVTAGTVLEGMKVSLEMWFQAVELFCRFDGVSTRALARQLPLPVKTAFALMNRIRQGLESDEGVLVGVVEWCRRVVACPRPPGVARTAHIVIAMDATTRLFVRGGRDATREELSTHSPEVEIPIEEGSQVLNRATGALAYARLRLRRTHRQVSRRYLERYVRGDAFLWRESRAMPPGATAREEVVALAMAVMRRSMQAGFA